MPMSRFDVVALALAAVGVSACDVTRADVPQGRVVVACAVVRECAPVVVSSPVPLQRPERVQ